MQLRVPQKEALTVLRKLIQDGHEAVDWMEKDYEKLPRILEIKEQVSMQEFKKKKEEEARKEEERKKQEAKEKEEKAKKENARNAKFLKAVQNNTSISDTIKKATFLYKQNEDQLKKSFEMISRASEELQKNPSFIDFLQENAPKVEDGSWSMDTKDKFYEIAVENYLEKRKEWGDEAVKALKMISGDYVRISQYYEAEGSYYKRPLPLNAFPMMERKVEDKYEDFVNVRNNFQAKIKFLQELYLEIDKKIDEPLTYIPERNTICWHARVVELQSSSNQSALCEFMFQFPIGAKKEMAEILASMEGVSIDELTKFERQKVINAVNEVNKKTKEMFKFPIFRKDKMTVYICPGE